MKIFTIGAGTMGAGIAQVFAAAGHSVALYDIEEALASKGYQRINKSLEKLVQKEKIAEQNKEATLANLATTANLIEAKECDLVIEAIVEDIDIKKTLFSKLDDICNVKTIFATNTSSLSVTKIASATKRGDKFVGMHFFNPAPVMKLVEVIRGSATSDETIEFVRGIAESIGKQPVDVNEAPGFVVNRILIPMINEAVGILADGVASREDIDKAMQLGANQPIGPLALADLIGNDVNLAILQAMYSSTCDEKYKPHPLLEQMVCEGKLGRKTKQGFFNY